MSDSVIIPTLLFTGVFSGLVLVIFWVEYRRLRARLLLREEQMRRRLYEIAILRELGERIGYSLNVRKIVDIISGSLGNLLPYSTVAYLLPGEEGRLTFHILLAEPVSRGFIDEIRERMLKSFSALFGKEFEKGEVDEEVSGAVTDPFNKDTVKSFFNVPIVINEKPAGVLTVASKQPGLYKTSAEVEILYTIMHQASDAVSKLEQVLEIEKGKLNAMVASMADGVLMADRESRLLVINPKTRALLRLSESATMFDVFEALSDKVDLRTKMEESLMKDELLVVDEVQMAEWFVQILVSPVKDKKNNLLGTVVLFHDITQEKELEQMREDFTSMMVHELRSPLTGIRSIAGLLKNEQIKNEQEKYSEFIRLIESNSSSMLDLVGDLLDVAKLEAGKFEIFKNPGDLAKVIHERLASFQSLAEENKITLDESVAPELPKPLMFDENKIGQVLNNLLSNAIKFTGAGGRVAVSAFTCKQSEDIARLASGRKLPWSGMKSGPVCPVDSVLVSVSDTGIGIPESELPKLFSKFQQLSTAKKSEKKGTGLGLVIVKGIAEAHGGQVGVFSEEGKGATFYFTLPIIDNAKTAKGNAKTAKS